MAFITASGGPQLFSLLASLANESYSASLPLNCAVPPCANRSAVGRSPSAPTVAATPPKKRRRESGCLTSMKPPYRESGLIAKDYSIGHNGARANLPEMVHRPHRPGA